MEKGGKNGTERQEQQEQEQKHGRIHTHTAKWREKMEERKKPYARTQLHFKMWIFKLLQCVRQRHRHRQDPRRTISYCIRSYIPFELTSNRYPALSIAHSVCYSSSISTDFPLGEIDACSRFECCLVSCFEFVKKRIASQPVFCILFHLHCSVHLRFAVMRMRHAFEHMKTKGKPNKNCSSGGTRGNSNSKEIYKFQIDLSNKHQYTYVRENGT